VTSPLLTGEAITAVIFDFGMTLVSVKKPTEQLDRAFDQIAQLLTERNYDPVPGGTRLRSAIGDRVDQVIADYEATGALEESDHVAAVASAYEAIGLELSPGDLIDVIRIEQRAWWSGTSFGPSTVPVLKQLRTHGFKLGICSNAPYYSPAMHEQFQHLGMTGLVDTIVLSADVGYRKPSPLIFSLVLKDLDTEARHAVFVGDRQREDIAGANQAGMRTVRIREHVDDDSGIWEADAVIEELSELPRLLGL
jgi:HAD superfamily hydrolase (TIGR01509 family)